MDTVLKSKNPLETEPVSKLIKKYSIPTAMTLMVNYLYNIVDQIFVGQGVGVSGMAATNAAFPITIVAMSLALLIGDGSASNISLCLGRKEQDAADKTVSHGLSMLIIAGISMAILSFVFAPKLIIILGTTPSAYNDSLLYLRITVWGLPFLMCSAALAAIIRADGNPQYTMKCMIVGAALNTVLDPIFIFVLKKGVAGAGIATIIGQTVSGLLCLRYMLHLKTVKIRKAYLIPSSRLSFTILKLGTPSFINQIMSAAVQITMNNQMTRLGASSIYGSDIALSVYGMIMKVYQIAHSMFVGVSSATQPINGFNFGAGHYNRVRQTYKTAADIGMLISVIWFAVYQLIPKQIGILFVSDNPLYLDACGHIFRLYMLGFIVYGLHMPTSSFFQSIGSPVKSLLIPVVRQGIILIPCAVILGSRFGLDGALLAAPIADIAAFLLSLSLALFEFRRWKKNGQI